MKWDRIEGDWMRHVSNAGSRWEKLDEGQLAATAGRRDHLAAAIQQAYGVSREAAQRQIDQWQMDQRATPPAEDEVGERVAGPRDRGAGPPN